MSEEKTAEADTLKWAKALAKENNWILNPDEKHLGIVIRGLVRNQEKFGKRYCPCRLRSGDAEKDRAIECPCIYHKDEIEKDGHCHCELYFKPT